MSDLDPPDDSYVAKRVEPQTPEDRFSILWKADSPPNLEGFIAEAGDLSPEELVAILRVDLHHRFERGERVATEEYLERYPRIREDADAAVDLIYNEFLLYERFGESPKAADYVRRFPDHAKILAAQIELHKAMATQSDGQSRLIPTFDPPTARDTGPSLRFPDPSSLPKEFGRYRLESILGRGGMGTVYRALDTQLDRQVALKIPHFEQSGDQRLVERFYREARAAASFNHPNLCPIHDVGQHAGVLYLTMPLLSGELLSKRLERLGLLSERDSVRIATRIAQALAVAHRAGVVHRDLKPANIMIGDDEEPIVMDFGLARREARETDLTLTKLGDLLGTPGYMAPEQVGGDSKIVGPESDVYSLGVMLYQMMTGRLPFLGPIHDVWRQVLSSPPTPPSSIRQGLDPRLETVCLKALSKDPKDRYPSMEALAEALDACVSSTNGAASAESGRGKQDTHPSPDGKIDNQSAPLLGLKSYFLFACAVVLVLSFVAGLSILRHKEGRIDPRPTSVAAEDPIPVGTTWSGEFRFRPPNDSFTGDVEVTIKARVGNRFQGNYRTENGKYEWGISGTLQDGTISWEFTNAIRDNADHDVVGRARVYGRIQDRVMSLVFWQTNNDAADMTLRRSAP